MLFFIPKDFRQKLFQLKLFFRVSVPSSFNFYSVNNNVIYRKKIPKYFQQKYKKRHDQNVYDNYVEL